MKVTANNGEQEVWRIARLHRVASRILTRLGKGQKCISPSDMVYSLHDHKGLLTVTWEAHPTKKALSIVQTVWEMENELAEMIVHRSLCGELE